MNFEYNTIGVCARKISFNLENGKIYNIKFDGGCPGNLKMISKILDGLEASKIIEMCSGNLCGIRGTSCSDQLAKAVSKALEEKIVC